VNALLAVLALAAALLMLAGRARRGPAPHARVLHLVDSGLGVPAIARRTGLSQDAVRVVLACSSGGQVEGKLLPGRRFRRRPGNGGRGTIQVAAAQPFNPSPPPRRPAA